MPHEITPFQALIVWALLARGGSSFQKDLMPEPKPKDRDPLVRARLISVEKRNRAIFLNVEEEGWSWAADHMDAELSTRSTAGSFVLRDLLARLAVFAKLRNIPLAEILSAAPPPSTAGDVLHIEPPPVPPLPQPADLRERIRAAFLKLTGGALNTRVRLADLRVLLSDLDRATQDKAILAIAGETDADLLQLDNRIDITDADREAALYVGAEPRHLLWISK